METKDIILKLRNQKGLSQDELAGKLMVTSQAVSRWKNGNYMPDIEMLQLLSEVFGVSINELLAGEVLSDEQFRKQADKNIVQISRQSAFTFEDKKKFWIRKWRKEHIGLFAFLFLLDVAFL